MKRFSLVTEILGGPQAETVRVCSTTHRSRQNTDFMAFTSADMKLCEAFLRKAPSVPFGTEGALFYKVCLDQRTPIQLEMTIFWTSEVPS